MRPILYVAIASIVCLGSSEAQQERRRKAEDPPATRGTMIVLVNPAVSPASVKDAVLHAQCIVRGSVQEATPRVRGNFVTVETEAVISVDQVLEAPGAVKPTRIVVTEVGGQVGELKYVQPGQSPMRKGESYILFLIPDSRPAPAWGLSLPRFSLVGVWAGKFKVENDTVRVSEPVPPGIRQYHNRPVTEFLEVIESSLKP